QFFSPQHVHSPIANKSSPMPEANMSSWSFTPSPLPLTEEKSHTLTPASSTVVSPPKPPPPHIPIVKERKSTRKSKNGDHGVISAINIKGNKKSDHELREEFYRKQFRAQTGGRNPPAFFPSRSAYDE